jgi:hypothetical protein
MSAQRLRDAGLGVLLVLGTVAYLYHWPRELYGVGEGLYLYENNGPPAASLAGH